jgi:copper chaperone NosL
MRDSKVESLRVLARLALTTIAAFSISCQKAYIEPVAIAAEDICSFCKMAISEKQYAAEFITNDGDALKFDDIGCLVEHIKGVKRTEVAAYFVTDFESRVWITAEGAHFVRSAGLKTPMGGGVIAFRNESEARESAARFHGSLLRFDEVIKVSD